MNEIKKLSDDEYFSSSGISNSSLKLFDRSPKHFFKGLTPTKSMDDGSICHKFILEPEDFHNKYFILPDGIKKDKRKNDYKEIESDLLAEGYDPNNILDSSYREKLSEVGYNILNCEIIDGLKISDILRISKKEVSIFWDCEIEGETIQKKGKLDILADFANYVFIIDLKKTIDCLGFDKAVREYQLYRQAAWYSEGIETLLNQKPTFIFLTFEFDNDIYGVKAYELDSEYIDFGHRENLRSLLKYVKWVKDGSQELIYPNGVETLIKPNYLN